MDLPKYHETFIPILQVLSDGRVMHYTDLRKKVRDNYYSDLSQDLLDQKTSSGENVLLNRIGWGKSYLKLGKFLFYPERGMVQITQKGQSVLKVGNLSLDDLKNDPDFKAHNNKKVIAGQQDPASESQSPQDLIDSGFGAIESQVKSDLLDKLRVVDPYYFEKIILVLLKRMGYGDFVETPKSGDGGVDGVINKDVLGLEKIYTQAKRYNENKVRESDIRNFIGAMSGDTSMGIFITTSIFDESAVKKAYDAHHSIVLIDGEGLVDLMYQYGVGLQVKDEYRIQQIDEDFFEGN